MVGQRRATLLPTLRLPRYLQLPLPADLALPGLQPTIFGDERNPLSLEKMPIRSYLLAIAIFANGAKGHAALHVSRDLDCQYKTACSAEPVMAENGRKPTEIHRLSPGRPSFHTAWTVADIDNSLRVEDEGFAELIVGGAVSLDDSRRKSYRGWYLSTAQALNWA
jgi:hypothetical protein